MSNQYQGVIDAAAVMMCLFVAGRVLAGSLNPTNAPGPTMHTLEEIYQKLQSLDPETQQRLSAATTVVNGGYYTATNLTAVETDLTVGNIATNVTLFGVAGTLSTTPAAVPKTGQTTSYAAWDDGVYQKGVAFPLPRFTIQSDTNCILDNMTGLIWARNANLGGSMSWSAAIAYCEALNYGGQTDWRLPNRNELNSLIDSSNYSPALPLGHPFVGVQNYHYWSGTSYVGNTGDAWCVGIGTGYVFNYSKPTNTYYVWPVRGGQ